jgi:predicted lipoprotein with Yx(FWY)xxD motif
MTPLTKEARMPSLAATRGRLVLAATLFVGILALLYAVNASGASRLVVRTAKNATLHKTILVNLKGRSLYSLSAERNGRFICIDAYCKSLWTPLVVPKGVTPTGAGGLATVRRPDGRTQVSYRGLPLYTFNEDRKQGDVKGNGFKDVGTWLVAGVASAPKMVTTTAGRGY